MFRFSMIPARRLALAAAAPSLTLSNSKMYYNKKAADNIKLGDEERWLEAELDENIIAPEERYARQKDLERMRVLLKRVNDHHEEKLKVVKTARDDEINTLKKQMKDLEERLQSLHGQNKDK